MSFDSYHWRRATLGTPELERARALLSTTHDRASFELLLRSHDTAAVGIALDQYQYGEATSRWGTPNPFAECSAEVAARARATLREPPSPATPQADAGANHASALTALTNLFEPEDANLVVPALAHTPNGDLRGAATTAAGRVLEKASATNTPLVAALEEIVAALEKMIFDDALSTGERIDALSSLAHGASTHVTDVLLRVLECPDVKLQAHAALYLLDRGEGVHRATVERVARTWPAEPPYPADEVLEALDAGEPSAHPNS
ncbi:MAG: hypothetical protein ABIY55_18090 [Kofleriaceae bacterium]